MLTPMYPTNETEGRLSTVNYTVVSGASSSPSPSTASRRTRFLSWRRSPAAQPSIVNGLTLVNRNIMLTTTSVTQLEDQTPVPLVDPVSSDSTSSHSDDPSDLNGHYALGGSSGSPIDYDARLTELLVAQPRRPPVLDMSVINQGPPPETNRSPANRPFPRRQPLLNLSHPHPRDTLSSTPRVRFLESDVPRCDSPIQEVAEHPPGSGLLDSGRLGDICHGILKIEQSFSGSGINPSSSPAAEIADIEQEITRKILIIGSDYTRGARRTYTISSRITLESPTSDKNRLKESFLLRGYSFHSFVNDLFDGDDALDRVAEFLSTAHCRDVRAIVFTGHANGNALIPPQCLESSLAIPAGRWEQTIRDNTRPGVIVLSIFASCFSGAFMQQPIDIRNLDSVTEANSNLTVAPDHGPVLLTFSSASRIQLSYESSIENQEPFRIADHFLYALDMTTRSPDIHSWPDFISRMEAYFRAAREKGSFFAVRYGSASSPEAWLGDNPQSPSYSASSIPEFPSIFPNILVTNPQEEAEQ